MSLGAIAYDKIDPNVAPWACMRESSQWKFSSIECFTCGFGIVLVIVDFRIIVNVLSFCWP